MDLAWMLSFTAIAVTAVAAGLVLFFSSAVAVYTDKGEPLAESAILPSRALRRAIARRRLRTRIAGSLLLLGFVLQLVAMLERGHPGSGGAVQDESAPYVPPPECATARTLTIASRS